MKKSFFNKNKYKKIVLMLSIIVAILTISAFTFPASTTEDNCVGEICEVPTFNTNELIEMNLYDYNDKINANNNANYNYPGFTQSKGPTVIDGLTSTDAFHFGDIITTDIKAAEPILGLNAINAPNPEDANSIFLPVRGAMDSTLTLNGYPALKGGLSLDYLFSNNLYATKKNNSNISHLFQYDENSGLYFYSSRDNHAEFDSENNKFIVYDKIITPDYLMYPFGNFLPFNSINSQTTKASLMGSTEIVNTFNRVTELVDPSKPTFVNDTTLLTQYMKLGHSLINLNSNLKQNYTAWDGVNKFLSLYYPRLDLSPDAITNLKNDFDNDLYAVNFDEPTNFFFGYDMKFNFMQPKDGLTGKNNENMVFHFEGDDDVWVYIDGVLFLELSGIHAQVGGEIDFANGEVRYYGFDNTTFGVSDTPIPGYTVKFENIPGIDKSKLISKTKVVDGKLVTYQTFKDYSTHELNFYYMERGASSGVMALEFNMPLIKDHAVTIAKEVVSSDEDAIGNKEYYFQIVKPNGNPFVNDTNVFSYDVYDKSDNKLRTVTTDSTGIIKLFKNERAVISGIDENKGEYYVRELLDSDYENVLVDGIDKLGNNNSTIEIGGKNYTIVSSDIKNIFNGGVVITFTNDIKTGQLKIKKTLENSTSESLLNTSFKFYVTINDIPLEVGTPYMNNHTVQTAGIIELKPGEEAVIDKIILNSEFKVVEDLSSTQGLTDSYKINGNDTGNKFAKGVISTSNAVSVNVVNTAKKDIFVEIPIQKITTNPDGEEHTYEFVLIDVNNKKTIATKPITVDENGIGSTSFKIEYPNTEATYNYQIKEVIDSNDNYTLYDESIYDIEVNVINDDGFKAIYTVGNNNNNIIFNNQKLSSLTIEKIVEGTTSYDNKFNFNIETSKTVDGTYNTKIGTNKGTITFTKGKATVTLGHGESITMYLPYGEKYSITETNKDGFDTMYNINNLGFVDGDSITNQTLNKDNVVVFKNIKGYELPKTGSSGMLIITFVGMIFIGISFIYLLKIKKKEGEI